MGMPIANVCSTCLRKKRSVRPVVLEYASDNTPLAALLCAACKRIAAYRKARRENET